MEFTSIFHDLVTEEYVEEGRHAPDHTSSPNLKGVKTKEEYDKRKKEHNDKFKADYETESGRKRRNENLANSYKINNSYWKDRQEAKGDKEYKRARGSRPGTDAYNKHMAKADNYYRAADADAHALVKVDRHKSKRASKPKHESGLLDFELI